MELLNLISEKLQAGKAKDVKALVQQAIDEEFESAGTKVDVKIGTMIELPRAALRAGISGQVVLHIEVRDNGRPGAVQVVESSGHRALDRAATRAVRRWRFEPATREGAPVASTVQQVISFDAPR